MLLNKGFDITVFDQKTLDQLGVINKFSSISWPDAFIGCDYFQLWCPINEENRNLIKKKNIIWLGGENACIIESIKTTVDDDGTKKYEVKGRTLESLLCRRIVWDLYDVKDKQASEIIYELVNKNCINPTDSKRKIPFLEMYNETNHFGGLVSCQIQGVEVYETCEDIATAANIGFDIIFNPREKKMIFKVLNTRDLTQGDDKILFSTDLEDVLSSSYSTSDENFKNVALVYGERNDQTNVNKKYTSGEIDSEGFDRYEMFVDSQSLLSTYVNENDEEVTLTDEEYNKILDNSGKDKLDEYKPVETFDAAIRIKGQYEYGKDYQKGDIVVVEDNEIGVTINALITGFTQDIDDFYEPSIVFGYQQKTLSKKLKKMKKDIGKGGA